MEYICLVWSHFAWIYLAEIQRSKEERDASNPLEVRKFSKISQTERRGDCVCANHESLSSSVYEKKDEGRFGVCENVHKDSSYHQTFVPAA